MADTAADDSSRGGYVTGGQEFNRDTNYIESRITRDGRDGYSVEAGRYRLIAARACPWANRAIIVRRLLGLEDALSLGLPGPTHDKRSWTFDLDPAGLDPVLASSGCRKHSSSGIPPTSAASPSRRLSTSRLVLLLPTTSHRSPRTSPPSGPRSTVPAPRICCPRSIARRWTR